MILNLCQEIFEVVTDEARVVKGVLILTVTVEQCFEFLGFRLFLCC